VRNIAAQKKQKKMTDYFKIWICMYV
jgi:hypothetical protein